MIDLICDDMQTFSIQKNKYEIINARNSLQFLTKKEAFTVIASIKEAVKQNGYIVLVGFTVDDPLYKKAIFRDRCFFAPQELKKIFSDFKIIFYDEKNIADNGHIGSPEAHRHGIVEMIAQKMQG